MEVLSFNFNSSCEEELMKKLLNEFILIEIDKQIAEKAIVLRKKYQLKLPDAIICASASVIDAIPITADKQLGRVKEINVRIINF